MSHAFGGHVEDLLVIARSGVLDPEWYARTYSDVAAAGADAFAHYLTQGWREGRDPGPDFDTVWYLDSYPEVLASGVNPLVDYLTTGWQQGRLPSRGFVAPAESRLVPDICPLVLLLALRRAPAAEHARLEGFDVGPVPRAPAAVPPPVAPLRTVAFYLPQFHPVAENDRWWGEGFTDWRNVRRGQPRFPGHQQPHVPTELGYYDLRDPMVMERQVDLARRHGVEAFCFYSYWFDGHRLLERPLDHFLATPSLDLGFCVCWANENWTRAWDGQDSQVLISQQHSPADDLAFIEAMSPYLMDPRYLRIDGRPLLLVYRASLLPDPRATADRWRGWCRRHGVGEIVLAAVQSFERGDPRRYGFDVAVEFPPNAMAPRVMNAEAGARPDYEGLVYDGEELALRSRVLPETAYPLWRGVCAGWDNEARRPGRGSALVGLTPELLEEWLLHVGRETLERWPEQERLIFVNAWNEWAEGAHLEPDEAHGAGYLQAVRRAQVALGEAAAPVPGVVVVMHDLHPHGAQLGSLALARELLRLGVPAEIVALGPGPLADEAAAVAPLHRLDPEAAGAGEEAGALARGLRRRGFVVALCNSAATGGFAPALHEAGIEVVGLVHELPGVLSDSAIERSARTLAQAADRLVFPSDAVRRAFPFPVRAGAEVTVRAQGVHHRGAPDPTAARARLREQMGARDDALVVLALGYGDHRKGLDLLAQAAAALPRRVARRDLRVAWAGRIDEFDERMTRALQEAGPRLTLLGFHESPEELLAGADLLVLPSREDPFPSVVLEAQAAGLPVVALAGATGAEEEIVAGGGLLVEATPKALARGVEAALALDPAAAAARRERAAREHSFTAYALDLIAGTAAAVPRVSVVLPNHDYADLVGGRIEQILAQTHPIYELVVVDDGSRDGSLDVIRAAVARCAPSVAVVARPSSSGSPYLPWLDGVGRTRGDLVWIAEPDDVADPEQLERLVARSRFPGVVLSYCQSRQLGPDGQQVAPDYLDYVSDVTARDWTRAYVAEGTDELAACLAVKNTIPNLSAVLFDGAALRDSLTALGEGPLALPTAPDYRLYVEVLRRGRIAFEPEALNGHRRHARSVVARGLGPGHIEEIREVQAVVRRLVVPTPSAARAGEAYLEQLTEQLDAERRAKARQARAGTQGG